MGKVLKEWSEGSVSIAVEAGKDEMNNEKTHVHIYKRGRRTKSRIPGGNVDLDNRDYDTAMKLYNRNFSEIDKWCKDVEAGKYDG